MKVGKLLILLFAILLFDSCNKQQVPLSEEQFKNLLIDIHRADATLGTVRNNSSFEEGKNYEYYNSIFAKYNIDRAEFDSCMIFYTAKNKRFSKMYDQVIDSLNKELSAAEIIMRQLKINDSLEYFIIPDTLNFDWCYKYVDLEIDSLESGLYKFSTTLKFDSIDRGKNNKIEAWFLTEDRTDTLRVRDVRVTNDTIRRNYSWQQYIDSTYTVLQMRYVVCDGIDTLKKRSARSWDSHLFRPYISRKTEERLQKELEYRKRENDRKKEVEKQKSRTANRK
ncbi:MAG: DUF4296 domain-containing protein [Marinifilaceae bacterium]